MDIPTNSPEETITKKARKEFLEMVHTYGSDPCKLVQHVPEVERWAKYVLERYPLADEEVVLLGVWLHDIGRYPLSSDVDHAITGEQRAQMFLEREGYHSPRKEKVLHCVLSHRCTDVMPQSLEARIVAFSDSASHITSSTYFDIAILDKKNGTHTVHCKLLRAEARSVYD